MSSGAHRRRASRPALVLLQILVFVTYIFGPTAAFAEDPAPEPTPIESVAPEPSTEPSADPTPAPSEPDPTPTPGTRPYLVTFAPGTDDARQLEILSSAGVTDESAIPQLRMRSVLLHEGEYADELAALNAFAEVARVDLDRTRAVEAAPSDTSYADQWSLPHVGWDQLYGSVGIAGTSTVAVLDTGVDASHPDLDGVVLPGTSILDGSNGLSDPNGHGTWMAGIVAAETDNGTGIAGVAYAGVSVLPVTVLGADGTGQDSDIIAGVVYAADAGADVILMSFSNPGYSPALQAAVDYAWASGAVLVAATGNDGSGTATFPAGDRGVIGVTSTDSVDALAAGANYGPAAFMAAPGVDITTTSAGGSVASISGTSAAAAEVAGAAALLSANEPALSNGVIVSRLARSADPAGDPAQTGNGRLNLARAMADASTDSVEPAGAAPDGDGGPLVGPYVTAQVNAATLEIRQSATPCVTPDTSFTLGEEVCARVVVTSTSGASANELRVQWFAPGAYVPGSPPTGTPLAHSTLHIGLAVGSVIESKFTPTTAGIWTVIACRGNTSAVCASGQRLDTETFTVVANAAPVAVPDSYSTAEDASLSVAAPGVLANDTDANGNPLTVASPRPVTAPTNGSLTLNANGSFTYTPNANFNGFDSFTYRATDGMANSNLATVTLTITAVDDAPVAVNDAATVAEDSGATAINVLANDTDIDGGPKAVQSVTQGTNGSVAITNSGADVTYTPNPNFCGTDSFTYTLNGGSTATVSVVITCTNDGPVAVDDSDTTDEDTFVDTDVVDNDTDVDTLNADLQVVPGSIANVSGGSAVLQADGRTIRFTPDLNANDGNTPSFGYTYQVTDGEFTDEASVTISVTAVNDAPVCVSDSGSTDEDVPLIDSVLCTDVDGDALTISVVDDVANGDLDFAADGDFTYTPNLNFFGSDGFSFQATDGLLNSNLAGYDITVNAVNDAPTCAEASGSTAEDTQLTETLVCNDVDNDPEDLTYSLVANATNGNAVVDADGSFSYTPNADYNGPDSFTFQASDGDLSSNVATFSVTVTEVNDAPIADDDSASVAEDESVNLDPRDGDVTGPANESGQSLTITLVSDPANGTAVIEADGTVTYTPDADFNGADSFTYTVCDDGTTNGAPDSKCDDGLVSITVTEVNDAPVVTAPADQSINENGTASISASFTDVDGGPHTCQVTWGEGAPQAGLITQNPAGTSGTCSAAHQYLDDNPTGSPSDAYPISVTVTDQGTTNGAPDPQSDTVTATVTVNDVAPDITFADATFNQVSGNVTSTLTFTDVGTQDKETATFKYTWTGTTSGTQTNTYTDRPFSATVVDVQHFDPGCYSILVEMFVTDDDTGSNSYSENLGTSLDFYEAGFRPPIRDDMRNIAKYGSVVPVKVELRSMCFPGTTVTSPTLHITIVLGDQTDNDAVPDTLVAESVSGADTGTQMRLGGGGYIYNLSTRSMQQGKEYTIRIREGSSVGPIILRALFMPKK